MFFCFHFAILRLTTSHWNRRHVGRTEISSTSSRSHTITTIKWEQTAIEGQDTRNSKLVSLVLAFMYHSKQPRSHKRVSDQRCTGSSSWNFEGCDVKVGPEVDLIVDTKVDNQSFASVGDDHGLKGHSAVDSHRTTSLFP